MSDKSMGRKKTLPPIYFLVAIVLAVALHLLLPLQQLLVFPWRLAGLFPLGLGIALNLMADQAFKEHNTTVKPFEQSSTLVTTGVFAVSRNPMYLGMALVLLGIAMLLGSFPPFAVVVALPVLLDRLFISPEEKMLQHTFGDQFREYRDRVRRWL
jgi:protein-S-isoprenylcysteine O-methyltransferase Ste14